MLSLKSAKMQQDLGLLLEYEHALFYLFYKVYLFERVTKERSPICRFSPQFGLSGQNCAKPKQEVLPGFPFEHRFLFPQGSSRELHHK